VATEKAARDKISIPEKYGMISCPHCDSIGKLYRGEKELIVCPTCGGFGAIKKPEGELFHTHRMMDHWKTRSPSPRWGRGQR
jgi:DNA-directed RNA polymerase subunit RPC12/RpoP